MCKILAKLKNKRGQQVVEYLLVMTCVIVVVVSFMPLIKPKLKSVVCSAMTLNGDYAFCDGIAAP